MSKFEWALLLGVYYLPWTIWFARGKYDSCGDMFIINTMIFVTIFGWPVLLWKCITEDE